MDYAKCAKDILDKVGGIENISYLTNCATRLRFNFKDDSKINLDDIQKIDGVVGAVHKGGQYQIIIGTDVANVRKEIEKFGPIASDSKSDQPQKKVRKIDQLMDIFAGIFTPLIPALTGGGMLKAVLTVLTFFGWMSKDSQTYYVLNFMADAVFYFLPILVGVSAAKKLNTNPYMAAVIGGVLLHPSLIALKTAGESVTFLGINMTLISYSSSVIPIILAVILMKYVEPLADRISPKPIKFLSKPLITLFVVGSATLLFLGPVGYWIGNGIAEVINVLNTNVPWLVPTLMGAFMPLLVMTGMHWSFVPLIVQSYASYGYEAIMGPGSFVSNICQGAASLAVALKTKNVETKQMATSAGITALFGVTEPALFGVTIKQKTVLASVMIGGAVGGLYAGINHVVRYTSGTPGLLSFAIFIGENPMNIVHALISVAIGFVITFVLVLVWGYKEEPLKIDGVEKLQTPDLIGSPVKGRSVSLSEVKDPTFANGIVGRGVAVIPEDGKIVAPFDGKVMTVFATKHAVGMIDRNGVELLIHIGIDTVKLEGRYFTAHVTDGQMVKKGDLLIEFDLQQIKDAGYDPITPVVVTNYKEFADIKISADMEVKALDQIIEVE